MQRELLLHPHLMRLDRFNTYMQLSRQLRNAHPSADKRKNFQLTIAQVIDVGVARIFTAAGKVAQD